MKYSKQEIRMSQFVFVYGPGSIIEGVNGSRLIPSLKGLGEHNCNRYFFEKNEIKDVRMQSLLNNYDDYENHLLSIPSNSSLKKDESEVYYSTIMFPAWHICHNRNPSILYYHRMDTEHCPAYNPKECYNCNKDKNPNVSFIRACPNGHLDEIYWNWEVHDKKKENMCKFGHNEEYYLWKNNGDSLSGIEIECPKCHKKTTMQKIYSYKSPCTGRMPELETLKGYKVHFTDFDSKESCDEKMKVIQKQSTSLRIPIIKTLLTIPEFDNPILSSLIENKLKYYLMGKDETLTEEEFREEIYPELSLKNRKELDKFFENYGIGGLWEEVNKVGNREVNFANSVNEEFKSLRGTEKFSENFSKSDCVEYTLNGINFEFPLKVYAIDKLSTVTAQIFYQRKPHPKENHSFDDEPEFRNISVGYVEKGTDGTERQWFPAFRGMGEGIFITSEVNPFNLISGLDDVINVWSKYPPKIRGNDRPEILSPLFVWWHTLSHALIKSLSLYCGYSSPSLHERVYIDGDSGGILIYNTSPGDDSGMGGLVDLVSNKSEFNNVLDTALDSLRVCSNDPLCSSIKYGEGAVNGSACHNCLLISETSCEHQNTLLDRHFFD